MRLKNHSVLNYIGGTNLKLCVKFIAHYGRMCIAEDFALLMACKVMMEGFFIQYYLVATYSCSIDNSTL